MKTRTYVRLSALLLFAFVAYWGFVYYEHASANKVVLRQLSQLHNGPYTIFAMLPFAQGEIMISEQNPKIHITSKVYHLYYVKNGFWGWSILNSEMAVTGLSTQNYNVDFEFLNIAGKTFVWGTKINPQLQQVVYHHQGKTYVSKPINRELWYFTLPFYVNPIYNKELTCILSDGTSIPLAK